MLTLKEPIKLNSLCEILTVSDALSEKIRANYSLMAAQFSPKELLLLLTTPTEFPEDMGGMTTITANSSLQNNQNVRLDVINNVVNRILMAEHADFTYQDEVYITTVLNKLGITNVAEFRKQARTITQENQSAYELLNLYQDNLELLTSLTSGLTAKAPAAAAKTEQAELPAASDVRYFIHNEIYKRLETADIYRIVNEFQNNQTVQRTVVEHNELKLAEQLRVSRALSLTERKSQTFSRKSVLLQHHVNHYELGDTFSAAQTEARVLSQAAAAVLLSTIDNVMVSRMSHIQLRSDFWLDIKNAVSQSAENSLSRFELYHSQYSVQNQNQGFYSEQLGVLYRAEISVINQMMQQFWQEERKISRTDASSATQIQNLKLEHHALSEHLDSLTTIDEGTEVTKVVLSTEAMTKMTEQILNRSELKSFPVSAPQASPAFSKTDRQPRVAGELIHPANESAAETVDRGSDEKAAISNETVTNLTEQISNHSERNGFTFTAPQPAQPASKTVPGPPASEVLIHRVSESYAESLERLSSAEKILLIAQQQSVENFEHNSLIQSCSSLLIDSSKRTMHQLQNRSEQQTVDVSLRQDARIYQNISQELSETFENVSLSAHTQEETLILQQQLDLINQRNKEVFERVREQQIDRLQKTPPAVPDRKRILSDALRALENPEQVISEMLQSPPVLQHREETAGIDAVLTQADETTRRIYEAVLKYQQNPQEAIAAGLIRPANEAALNAQILETQEQKTVELTHRAEQREQETVVLHDTAERVIEQLRELPGHSESHMLPQQRPRVPTVHKMVESQVSDELLERMEQQNRKEKAGQVVDHTVVQETINQTQISRLSEDIVAKTTEDITEIVNRTLARQIGTISDRVYSQMEKKLQTERARRGRF